MGIEAMAGNTRLDALRAALGSGITAVLHDTRAEAKVVELEPKGAGDALQALAKRLRAWGFSVGAAREERYRRGFDDHVAVAEALVELLQATKDPCFRLQVGIIWHIYHMVNAVPDARLAASRADADPSAGACAPRPLREGHEG